MKNIYTQKQIQDIENMDKNILQNNFYKMSTQDQNIFKQNYGNTKKYWTIEDNQNLTSFKWYDKENQVGIPWVNLVKNQNTIEKNPISISWNHSIPSISQKGKIDGKEITENNFSQNNNSANQNFSNSENISKTPFDLKAKDVYGRNVTENNLNNFYNSTSEVISKAWDLAEPLQRDFNKNFYEANKSVNDTYDAYTIRRWDLEKNKWYYKNFDNVDGIFNNVLNDLRVTQKNTWTLTNSDYQMIASKYWLSIDEIKNPWKIFEKLEFTSEWEQKFWINKSFKQIENLQRDNEWKKEELSFELEWTLQNLDNQINDTKEQLKKNLSWAEASGTWNSSFRSSWYQLGLDYIKKDAEKIIWRLQNAKDRAIKWNDIQFKRLNETFNQNLTEAKQDLDLKMKELKFDVWLQLNTASKKYGIDSEDLTKALYSIRENLWISTMDLFTKYNQNIGIINQNMEKELDIYDHKRKIIDERENKRYNELIANNGLLIQNTSLNQLVSQVEAGIISPDRAFDIKNIMLSSIQSSLWKIWILTTEDLQEIDNMLESWYTPQQIVSKFANLDRFKPKEKPIEINSWNALIDPTTGKVIYKNGSPDKFARLWDNAIYNTRTWEVRQVSITGWWKNTEWAIIPKWATYRSENVNWTITQTYGTTSPLWIDNVKLANGKVWTPWVDIAWVYGSKIKTFTDWEVIRVITGKKRWDAWYGNSVYIKDKAWNIHMYNHLADVNVKVWDKIYKHNQIWTMWNSGSTLWENWTHLDYRVTSNWKTWLKEWNWIDPGQFMKWSNEFKSSDINTYNSLTDSSKLKLKDDPWYIEFEAKREEIYSNPNASIDDILKYSRWWKKLTDSHVNNLQKFESVLWQIWDLQTQISKMNTWPIIWRLKNLNPYDTDVAVLKAQLNSLVPWLARWIYGEVWVLTAADIEHYAKTIPNLKSTKDINNAILSMNLKMIAWWYKSQLSSLAASGGDVSGYRGAYDSLMAKVRELESSLPKIETKPTIKNNVKIRPEFEQYVN